MADIFPPEIFDTILDHVYLLDEEAKSDYYALDYSLRTDSNKPVKTLLSCSLVCRSWLPRTRLHTFETVHIPSYYDRTIGLTFGALVAHPLCTFRSHVRRLSLNESYNRNPSERFWINSLWINSVLPQLALLPHVEDISIYCARFTDVAEEEWRAVFLWGPQLKRLDMHSIHFDRVSRMTELVSRCTNLEHLALHYIEDGDLHSAPKGGDIFVRTPPLRFLRSLSLDRGTALRAEFLTWLCPRPGSITVHTVELACISIKDAHHVARFLYDIGQSITSLAIDFLDSSPDSTDGQDAFCRVADLTTLTKLETLRFGYVGRWSTAKHVPSILAKLNSPCLLKKIRFHLMMDKAADLEMIDWENIVIRLWRCCRLTGPFENLEEAKTWLHEHVGKRLKRNVEIRFAPSY
ncbi:hypothetical protein BDZ89DRAFT_1077514 [Hymenopellis radicata]|nr:hypothetical protein BDZ89DRAFT_1077514 [Hymenopellis radicata]